MLSRCSHVRQKASSGDIVDDPCWGRPEACELKDLLDVLDNSAILQESDDYIVLNKPPDLRMDGNYPATVLKLLTYWYPPKSIANHSNLLDILSKLSKSNDLEDTELRPCHQLDYATSGVLLIGRHRVAAGQACEAFRDRTCQKTYLAIIHSHLHIKCTTLNIAQEDLYEHIRRYDKLLMDRRKGHRETFKGYQPPYSIFSKWKGIENKGGKRDRDSELIQRIQEKLSETDRETLKQLSWSAVKQNQTWKLVFEEAANIYNDSLRAEISLLSEPTKEALDLPRVFRLEHDDPDVFYINASLAQHPTDFAMVIQPASLQKEEDETLHLDFRDSITRCNILTHTYLKQEKVTKVKLQPLTGRRHQLRCHMALVEAPIVGDVTYEGDHPQSLSERMCLHSYELKIPNTIDVCAPDPFTYCPNQNEIQISFK
jgi:23S rRNA-/tRNA-specific pseudouridylate synthase